MVKRYVPYEYCIEHDDGDFVKFEDYQKLEKSDASLRIHYELPPWWNDFIRNMRDHVTDDKIFVATAAELEFAAIQAIESQSKRVILAAIESAKSKAELRGIHRASCAGKTADACREFNAAMEKRWKQLTDERK